MIENEPKNLINEFKNATSAFHSCKHILELELMRSGLGSNKYISAIWQLNSEATRLILNIEAAWRYMMNHSSNPANQVLLRFEIPQKWLDFRRYIGNTVVLYGSEIVLMPPDKIRISGNGDNRINCYELIAIGSHIFEFLEAENE